MKKDPEMARAWQRKQMKIMSEKDATEFAKMDFRQRYAYMQQVYNIPYGLYIIYDILYVYSTRIQYIIIRCLMYPRCTR